MLYDYQTVIKDRLISVLRDTSKIPVLAVATGGGKTEIMIYAIREMLQANPALKFVVLAHGQTVLRSQFYSRILGLAFPEIRVCQVAPGVELDTNANVLVGLPVNFKKLKGIKADYVVTDEAHERVGSAEHTDVVKSLGKPRQILLTASHGDLDPELPLEKITFSLGQAYKAGVVADLAVVGVNTVWEFDDSEYNADDNLKLDTKIAKKAVLQACEDLIKGMQTYHIENKLVKAAHKAKVWLFDDFPKSVIACHSIAMANTVHGYFKTKLGDKVVVSHSKLDDDYDIREFDKGDKKLLIVVDRAKIGFDAPSIKCLVDMTGTKNVGMVMQLMGRVVRRHPDPSVRQKTYFKVMPETMEQYNLSLITAAMVLGDENEYAKWNGVALNKLVKVPVRLHREPREPRDMEPREADFTTAVPPTLSEIASKGIEWVKYSSRTRGEAMEDFAWMTLSGIGKIGNKEQPEYYKEILKSLKTRPNQKDTNPYLRTLGTVLSFYTNPGACYDPVFDKAIRSMKPQWFENTVETNKERLLSWNPLTRPNKRSSNPEEKKLASALQNYTRGTSNTYDPEFTKKIRELKPAWFINTAKQNKALLLKWDPLTRPNKRSSNPEEKRLGIGLAGYLDKNRGTYDAAFDAEIRRRKPNWFLNITATNKELIKKLDKKPSSTSKKPEEKRLGILTNSYIRKRSGNYDPIFDAEIRKLKPHWFK